VGGLPESEEMGKNVKRFYPSNRKKGRGGYLKGKAAHERDVPGPKERAAGVGMEEKGIPGGWGNLQCFLG